MKMQPVSRTLIHGSAVKPLKPIPDERGRLMEILRNDDAVFERFGQVYTTTAYPGVVKGWHYHKLQTDHFSCVYGMMKLVLADVRHPDLPFAYEGPPSPTAGVINEYFLGLHNPILVKIPPFVLHGFKAVGTTEAIVINVPTEVYRYSDPDEYRIPPHDPRVGYAWALQEK